MNEIELKSLAKINLGLDVLGRRENGYHDVRMVMQSIYLHDEVKIEKKRREGIEIVSNLRFLPIGEGNIAYKAAHMPLNYASGRYVFLKLLIDICGGIVGYIITGI